MSSGFVIHGGEINLRRAQNFSELTMGVLQELNIGL